MGLILQWDILSNGGLVEEMAHIANGRDPGNSVSLLRVNVRIFLTKALMFYAMFVLNKLFVWFCSELELRREQHVDLTRKLYGRIRILRDIRTSRHDGYERCPERR